MKRYDVVDTASGTILGSYGTEGQALALVRKLVGDDEAGRVWAEDLAIGWEAADGSFGEPVSGAALLARLEAAVAAVG